MSLLKNSSNNFRSNTTMYNSVDKGSKKPVGKKTKANEALLNKGLEIINQMSEEERALISSKSHTLHFQYLLGLSSKKSSRKVGDEIKDSSTPVGVALISDEDIMVPVIDVLKNKDTGIDPEKDITYREVKAGELFYLTLYEFMFLIIRDEYGGFCCDEYGNSDGVHLSVKSPAFYRGDAKLPTPTINYNKKYGRRSIKAGMVDIDVYMPDGSWVIKPQYADKFGALLKNTEKYRKISGGKLPPAPTLVALALKEKLNLNVAKKEEE